MIPFIYNIENDIRYRQGMEAGEERGIKQGIEQERYTFIQNLLLKTKFWFENDEHS